MILEKNWTDETGIYFEHDLVIDESTYLVIFGYHVNGGWICIPNHSWGCEASDNEYTTDYNVSKLVGAGASKEIAEQIACYIDTWLQENREEVSKIRISAQNRMMNRINQLKKS